MSNSHFLRNFFKVIKTNLTALVPYKSFSGVTTTITSESSHCFIGYYDLDPVNSLSEVFFHEVPIELSNMSCPSNGYIKFCTVNGQSSERIGNIQISTRALNWQLGSRCQWLDNDNVVLNDVSKNNLQISKVVNVLSGREVENFDLPFWQLSKSGQIAVSLNFQRLRTKRPGYGYTGNYKFGKQEVLILFSTQTGVILNYFLLEDILDEVGLLEIMKFDPYLNHVSWAPCGEKFVTLIHYDDPLAKVRKIFPILINIKLSKTQLLLDTGYFSHHIWNKNGDFLAYLEMKGTKTWAKWNPNSSWIPLSLNGDKDGHPTEVKTDKIIVDTYPNRLNLMSLNLYDAKNGSILKSYGNWRNLPHYIDDKRCDLHPRYSENSDRIIVDIPAASGRKVLFLEAT